MSEPTPTLDEIRAGLAVSAYRFDHSASMDKRACAYCGRESRGAVRANVVGSKPRAPMCFPCWNEVDAARPPVTP